MDGRLLIKKILIGRKPMLKKLIDKFRGFIQVIPHEQECQTLTIVGLNSIDAASWRNQDLQISKVSFSEIYEKNRAKFKN